MTKCLKENCSNCKGKIDANSEEKCTQERVSALSMDQQEINNVYKTFISRDFRRVKSFFCAIFAAAALDLVGNCIFCACFRKINFVAQIWNFSQNFADY